MQVRQDKFSLVSDICFSKLFTVKIHKKPESCLLSGFYFKKIKNMFKINIDNTQELQDYLINKKVIAVDDAITDISKPGEGNMNCVLRIRTNKISFIVKQSRDYVEKYPQVAAPEKRVLVESAFYKKIKQRSNLQKIMPEIIFTDELENILILQDLGTNSDFSYLYQENQKISPDDLVEIIYYLNNLHQSFSSNDFETIFENIEMKRLNHEHIFEYPFMIDNGFDLDNIQIGLQSLAMIYKKDTVLKNKIAKYGTIYLTNGDHLLHGDYYFGSFLKTENGIKIIDPEFCFFGYREFDLGVLIAHLYLSSQDDETIELAKDHYFDYKNLDLKLLNATIGIEIMRRTIGLAQVPLSLSLIEKENLLVFAKTLIV